jgi:hypothetical protein
MKKIRSLALAAASLFVSFHVHAQYADAVVAYNAGTGIAAGYNDPTRTLGSPTVFIGYQNADPFNPPFRTNDIAGVGTGGSLTLQFNTPVLNNAANPFGLDFIIFGHAGFTEDFSTGTTDGSLFTGGTSNVRVSVSTDGVNFFMLNPALTPKVDGLFPTDASGNSFLPVNPALTGADFAGKDLAGIRALYAGSGGGAGFNLSWAIDGNNQPVSLASIDFVRLDVVSGGVYVDAVSVVPEPAAWSLLSVGATVLLLCKHRASLSPRRGEGIRVRGEASSVRFARFCPAGSHPSPRPSPLRGKRENRNA